MCLMYSLGINSHIALATMTFVLNHTTVSVIAKDRCGMHYQFESTECEARGKLSN